MRAASPAVTADIAAHRLRFMPIGRRPALDGSADSRAPWHVTGQVVRRADPLWSADRAAALDGEPALVGVNQRRLVGCRKPSFVGSRDPTKIHRTLTVSVPDDLSSVTQSSVFMGTVELVAPPVSRLGILTVALSVLLKLSLTFVDPSCPPPRSTIWHQNRFRTMLSPLF